VKPRPGTMDARALRRIGALFHELADEYERLAAEENQAVETKPRRTPVRRTMPRYVPDTVPSDLDVARAKAVLKRLGLK
jgi:hypothetical protein